MLDKLSPNEILNRALALARGQDCLNQIIFWLKRFKCAGIINDTEFSQMICKCKKWGEGFEITKKLHPYTKSSRDAWWQKHYLAHIDLTNKN